ncbi:ABC-type glycerol-3-phosphate transport system substrate-binding protein [Anaerotaenia torta]|uniref:extracellular solute-binding protein n=1 Tax=Anaerotaenia torta TaxID=433293 RepID=UPI003D1DB8F9
MVTKRKSSKTVIILAAAVLLAALAIFLVFQERNRNRTAGTAGYQNYEGYAPEGSYASYLSSYEAVSLTENTVVISAADYSGSEGEIEVLPEYEGQENAVLTGEDGYIEWTVNIPETAFYQIEADYLTYGGSGLRVERSVYIDGSLPFREAEYLVFPRCFTDMEAQPSKDLKGNDIRPNQQEQFVWQNKMLYDTSGYYADPLMFYLTRGIHTIRLVSEREPLLLKSLTLRAKEAEPDYAKYLQEITSAGYSAAAGGPVIIQAENMLRKSEKSNYPINDRTSSYTQPQKAFAVLLNSMGGTRWQTVGSTAQWKITVDHTGLYRIALRFKQDYLSGVSVARKLTIDGEVPFKEAENLVFGYAPDWQCSALGDGTQDYQFYFEAGKEYTLALEVVLGDMSNILRRVETSVEELNQIYRSILMVAGATPDKYRDYSFEKIIPQTIEALAIQAEELTRIKEELLKVNGRNGERMAQLTKMEYLVHSMAEDPDEIAGKFATFKDNVAALASWVLEMKKQPLSLDYIALVPEGGKIPAAEGNWLQKLVYQVKLFAASFVMDYSEMGITKESMDKDETITVWLSTGRDQMNTLRSLINSDFTQKNGISVELELVSPGTLLPSVLAGTGPDVALSNGMGDPINLALRNSVYDLSRFGDFEEVVSRFADSTLVPYQYQGRTYALPETVNFNMLFYRKDIFGELGLSVPGTWDEWDNVIGELSKKNMTIGLPHDQNILLTFMYQMDCELYNNDGETVNLDSREAVLSFEKLMEYYTLYKFPTEYDFVNRFRTGEIPLAIADYTVYNQLSLFAPEIQGEWGMELVPGTLREDGSINRSNPLGGTAAVILNDTEHTDAAWTFLQWWTSTEVQAAYCNEMESVINASAKQPTANLAALKQLPWNKRDLANLVEEWSYLKGTPEVPGGYYVGRIYSFAFNKVKDNKEDPADTLQKYIKPIDAELARKRQEFGLSQAGR